MSAKQFQSRGRDFPGFDELKLGQGLGPVGCFNLAVEISPVLTGQGGYAGLHAVGVSISRSRFPRF